jgi:hypothetical protein
VLRLRPRGESQGGAIEISMLHFRSVTHHHTAQWYNLRFLSLAVNDLAISFYTPLIDDSDWDSLTLRLQVFNAGLMRICGVLSNGIVCVLAMMCVSFIGYGIGTSEDTKTVVQSSVRMVVCAFFIGLFSYFMAKITSKCQRMTKLLNTQDNSRLKSTNLRLMLTLPLVSCTALAQQYLPTSRGRARSDAHATSLGRPLITRPSANYAPPLWPLPF